jgi:hypothetical protein
MVAYITFALGPKDNYFFNAPSQWARLTVYCNKNCSGKTCPKALLSQALFNIVTELVYESLVY